MQIASSIAIEAVGVTILLCQVDAIPQCLHMPNGCTARRSSCALRGELHVCSSTTTTHDLELVVSRIGGDHGLVGGGTSLILNKFEEAVFDCCASSCGITHFRVSENLGSVVELTIAEGNCDSWTLMIKQTCIDESCCKFSPNDGQISRLGTTWQPLLGKGNSLLYTEGALLRRRWLGTQSRGLVKQGPPCSTERPVSNDLPVPISRDTQMEEDDSGGGETFVVEDAIKEAGFGVYQGWLLAYAGMSWTAEAMEMMLLSFVGPAVQSEWGLTGREESLIASVVFGGMMIGAYSWGVLSDAKGRRFGFFATAVLTFVAGLLSATSPNYLILVLLRGLVGVGLGGGPVVSAWFMEFVPSANRGLWMVIISLFWTLGSILEASLAWAVMPTLGWRWLLGLSSVPLAILLLFYSIVPESPRYLAAKGETEKAFKILQQMAKVNGRPLRRGRLVQSSQPRLGDSPDSSKRPSSTPGNVEMVDIVRTRAPPDEVTLLEHPGNLSVAKKTSVTSGVDQVFSNFTSLLSPPLLSSTLLLWSVFFANAFTYYGLVLLTSQLSGGATDCRPEAAATIISAASDSDQLYRNVFVSSIGELPGLAVAAYIVDRWGRKRSMATLFTLCGAFLLPLVYVQSTNLTTFLLFGARACIMGAFTVLYIYAPEVYPTNSRSTGLGIANAIARIGGLLCPLVAVDLVRSCQQGVAVSLFSAVTVVAGVAVMFFPVETQGRALSDTVDSSSINN